jgi:hypothetical protein
LPFYEGKYNEGATVYSVGFPGLGNEMVWQFGQGNISNSDVTIGSRYIQHTATIDPGNSGGPLLIESNESPIGYSIIGINTLSINNRHNSFYSVPIDLIKLFINKTLNYEPNDGMENAIKIGLEKLIITKFNTKNDIDWYYFNIPTDGGKITLIFKGKKNIYPNVSLYNKENVLIHSINTLRDNGNEFTFNSIEGGKYFLRISESNNKIGTYAIFSQFIGKSTTDIYEENDSYYKGPYFAIIKAFMNINTINAYMTNYLLFSGTDYYKTIIPKEGGKLKIYTSGDIDLKIELYDRNMKKIAEDDDSGGNRNALIEYNFNETPNGELIFIYVHGMFGSPNYGNYSLNMEFQ